MFDWLIYWHHYLDGDKFYTWVPWSCPASPWSGQPWQLLTLPHTWLIAQLDYLCFYIWISVLIIQISEIPSDWTTLTAQKYAGTMIEDDGKLYFVTQIMMIIGWKICRYYDRRSWERVLGETGKNSPSCSLPKQANLQGVDILFRIISTAEQSSS